MAATTSADGSLRIWAQSPARRRAAEGKGQPPTPVAAATWRCLSSSAYQGLRSAAHRGFSHLTVALLPEPPLHSWPLETQTLCQVPWLHLTSTVATAHAGRPMTAAAFSGDGSLVAAAVPGSITLWDPAQNALVAVLANPGPARGSAMASVQFVPGTPFLVRAPAMHGAAPRAGSSISILASPVAARQPASHACSL